MLKRLSRLIEDSFSPWFLLGVFIVFQLIRILTNFNGPFFDEGIYITSGLRTLAGNGIQDGYLTWFAGSLLYPTISGLSYQFAGLSGVRIVSMLFGTVIFVMTTLAAGNLFGKQAKFWTALALLLCGPLFGIAHLGVYDLPALAGIATSFWALTKLKLTHHRFWLCVAALAFACGVISKYPLGLMALPLIALLWVLREKKFFVDLAIFGFINASVYLAYFIPLMSQLNPWLEWAVSNRPVFGVTKSMILYALLNFSLIPVILAFFGFRTLDKKLQPLGLILFGSSLIWPLYHLASGNPVGDTKHIVSGFIFSFPLIGVFLNSLWTKKSRLVALIAVIFLLLQLAANHINILDHSWPNMTQPGNYLIANADKNQKYLINNSWPYTMELFNQGLISSPWNVFDVYRVEHGESEDLCSYDWFVNEQGSYSWPQSVHDKIAACGTYEKVFSHTSMVTGLGNERRYITYPVTTDIWKNMKGNNE